MKKYDYLIVGAGLYGAVMAYELGKKVDLDNLINKDVIVKPEIKVSVISYEKEEAFLEALKQLQQTLN